MGVKLHCPSDNHNNCYQRFDHPDTLIAITQDHSKIRSLDLNSLSVLDHHIDITL